MNGLTLTLKYCYFSNDNDVSLYVHISGRNYHTCVTHTMVQVIYLSHLIYAWLHMYIDTLLCITL